MIKVSNRVSAKGQVSMAASDADDGMGEAENFRCASSTSKSEAPQTLIPCMRAAAPLTGATRLRREA